MGRLTRERLRGILTAIFTAEPEEIGCDECFAELDRFAETVLAGLEVPEALRRVEAHLRRCRDCREEYEALLAALRAMEEGNGRPR